MVLFIYNESTTLRDLTDLISVYCDITVNSNIFPNIDHISTSLSNKKYQDENKIEEVDSIYEHLEPLTEEEKEIVEEKDHKKHLKWFTSKHDQLYKDDWKKGPISIKYQNIVPSKIQYVFFCPDKQHFFLYPIHSYDFASVRNKRLLHILSDVAIARASQRIVNTVYLLFLVQQQTIEWDLSNWDSSRWLKHLEYPEDTYIMMKGIQSSEPRSHCVGYHIGKEKTIIGSLQTFYCFDHLEKKEALLKAKIPIQIFIGSPQIYAVSTITDKDIAETVEYIKTWGLHAYIHACYVINLSTTNEEQLEKGLEALIKNLKVCKQLTMRGVVLHVGKALVCDVDEAVSLMKTRILDVLKTKDIAPLLLETPSGQGSEILTTYKEFATFAHGIYDCIKNKEMFKIVIDTCHVYAAGHENPAKYIQDWINEFGVDSIGCVHLNDSKESCGACKDRHARLGSGYIGRRKMLEIIALCTKYNIDMIIE